jgi:hypothetical protein
MTDWNKGQLILLVGACIAVFGSVYFLAAGGPESSAAILVPQTEIPRPVDAAPPRSPPAAPIGRAVAIAPAADPPRARPSEPSPAELRVRRMAENPTVDDVAYLGDIAQRDGDADLRVVAIEGLQRAAMSGDDGGASSRALRQIASSRDPQISHAARRAISQIGARNSDE